MQQADLELAKVRHGHVDDVPADESVTRLGLQAPETLPRARCQAVCCSHESTGPGAILHKGPYVLGCDDLSQLFAGACECYEDCGGSVRLRDGCDDFEQAVAAVIVQLEQRLARQDFGTVLLCDALVRCAGRHFGVQRAENWAASELRNVFTALVHMISAWRAWVSGVHVDDE